MEDKIADYLLDISKLIFAGMVSAFSGMTTDGKKRPNLKSG